jgi:hypothetical protein
MIALLAPKTRFKRIKHLYRILAAAVILLPLASPLTCVAQKKARSKLRALAVVELPAYARVGKDMELPPSARLRPITIFQNGEYQDATFFRVNPMPMALEPGTVYDVLQSGDSLGLLTIESAGKVKDDWLARGRWKSSATQLAAKQAAAAAVNVVLPSDERPHLKRGGSPAASQPGPTPTPAPTATPSQTAPAPAPAQPAPSSTANAGASSATDDDDPSKSDPDRPALRRGKPVPAKLPSSTGSQVAHKQEPAKVSAQEPIDLPAPALKKRGQVDVQYLAAISDASPYDAHSFKFPWTDAEKQRLTSAIEKQALAELTAYAVKNSRTLVPASFTSNVEAFDLDYDNDAELVLTAKYDLRKRSSSAKGALLQGYITYVAHLESSGELHKLFSEITDDDLLDLVGRMQLVDAVDADGDGHAELLFHRVGATTQSFELYRAGRDQLWKLFEGAESQKN